MFEQVMAMGTAFTKRPRPPVCGRLFALACAALLTAPGSTVDAQAAITFRNPAQANTANGQTARFYMQNAAPDVAIATHRGAWDATASVLQRKLASTKAGAIASRGVAEASATNNYDVLILKFVSEPILNAQTVTGTLNWVAGSRESNTAMNAHWHVHAYVTQGDTDTLRGTLATNYTEPLGTNEWPTTAVGDGPAAAVNLSSVAISANDRIVVEAGYVARNTSATSRTGTLWYGGINATDLALGGDETTLPGWWEFSQDLFNLAPLTIAVPAGTVANDVMVAAITVRPCSSTSGGACTVTIRPPAGWTQAASAPIDQTTGGGVGGFGNRLFVYYRVASGSEPASYTWLFGGGPVPAGAAGGIMSFSGVDTTSPIVAEAGQTTASGTSHDAPSIDTGAVTNTMLVSIHSANSSASWDPPGAMTERVDAASLAVPNDLGLSIEMNHESFAGSGVTGARTASWVSPPNADTGATYMLALRPASAVDHFAISHSGSGVTCAPESVTISAHDAAHGVVTSYAGTITLSTSTGRGDWSLITGGGAFSNGTVNDGVATYTFVLGDSGQVVLGLKDTVAETVNINVTDGSASETSGSALASEDQNLAFATAGFRITDGAGNPVSIATQTAGVTSATYGLQAIRTDTSTGACVGVFTGLVANIELASECNNPTTCQAGQQVTFTNNGSGTIASNPNGSVTSFTARTLSFGANSEAQFTFSYPDVGAIKLHARYNIPLGDGSASGNYMTGASNSFVVKPFGFTVSNIKRTADSFANPGAADASGTIFIKAGDDFTVTVRATTSGGAATPNYGRETTPEGVLLTPNLVAGLGLTANPAITNGSIAGGEFGAGGAVSDSDGEATVTNLAWGEVGVITLTPSVADGDYLGAGDVTGTATGNVGRFTPFDFGVAYNSPEFGTGCGAGTFTYVGQKFNYTTSPAITVTARNKSGATTQNYKGTSPAASAWFKITSASLTGKTYAAAVGALDTSLIGSPDPVITDNGNGTGTLTFGSGGGIVFTRSTPVAPFDADIALSINVIDSDGIAFAGAAFGAATPGNGIAFVPVLGKAMRFGRLKLSNAYGSELINLPVSIETQYYNGTVFITNADDDCTTLVPNNLKLTTTLTGVTATLGGVFVNGKGSLTLSKPSPAAQGTVDICVDLDVGVVVGDITCQATTPADMTYLQGKWSGASYDKDPAVRGTFGLYKSPNEIIFIRENY